MSALSANAPAKGTGLASIGSALWAGFVQPSLFSLILMILVFAATVLTVFVGVTPARMSGPFGDYLARTSDDAEGFATRDAYRLADPGKPISRVPHIYVIGNSLIAQSFANVPKLAKALETTTHRTWDAFIMTSGAQGALDEAALVDYATKRQPGVVVLSVGFDRFENNPGKLMYYYKLARLGFRSDLAEDEVKNIVKASPKRRTGIFILDNKLFFLRNANTIGLRLLALHPAEQRVDNFIYNQTPEHLAKYRQGILDSLRQNYQHGDLAVSLLANTISAAQARGSKVILFQTPVSEAVLTDPADRKRHAVHVARSAALAARLGASYCSPPASGVLPDRIFKDYYHLKDAAWQERFRMILAECVSASNYPGKQS
jgi:hypothetical protein